MSDFQGRCCLLPKSMGKQRKRDDKRQDFFHWMNHKKSAEKLPGNCHFKRCRLCAIIDKPGNLLNRNIFFSYDVFIEIGSAGLPVAITARHL